MENTNKSTIAIVGVVVVALLVAVVGILITQNNQPAEEETNPRVVSRSSISLEAENNIVETAQATENLSTLVAAVQAAELVDALSDETAQFTVFAPRNAAFADIQSTVDTLLEPENQSDLQNVLQYHVVQGAALSSDLNDEEVMMALNGDELKIRIVDGEVHVNNAKVVTADVETSNGVVHIIDQVLVPGTFGTVVDAAAADSRLDTLVTAVQAAELTEALNNPDASYTVFAPRNAAFAEIQDTVDTLLQPNNISDLQNVLQYHVVPAEAFSAELTDGQQIETLNGEMLTVDINNQGVFIVAANSRARVLEADIKTSNGVVHVIDTVLLP